MLAKLVEHPRLSFFASPFITALQTLQLFFPTTALFHFHPSVCRCHFPVRQRILFASFPTPAPVSLIMSQLACNAPRLVGLSAEHGLCIIVTACPFHGQPH